MTLDQFTVTVTVPVKIGTVICYSLHISTVIYGNNGIHVIMLSNPKGSLKVVCVNICRSL